MRYLGFPYKSQKGGGLLNFFGKFSRVFKPLAKSTLHSILKPAASKIFDTVKNEAIDAGKQVAGDVLQGKNLKESLKQRGTAAIKRAAEPVKGTIRKSAKKLKEDISQGIKKGVKQTAKQESVKKRGRKKKTKKTIFDEI